MKIARYKVAKQLVLLEAIKTKESKSGKIILNEETFVGYYKVIAIGPLVEKTAIGDYIVSTLQMGVELEFEEGLYMQMPEAGIDGYYSPIKEELINPVPILKKDPAKDEEELNVIDSEDGNNNLGEELGLRNN